MYCRLPGVSIFYEARGRGRPFVMLHGSPSDHGRAMVQVEPAFRSRTGWRRFYPDLPGHGKSRARRESGTWTTTWTSFLNSSTTWRAKKGSRLEGSRSGRSWPWPSLDDVAPKWRD